MFLLIIQSNLLVKGWPVPKRYALIGSKDVSAFYKILRKQSIHHPYIHKNKVEPKKKPT